MLRVSLGFALACVGPRRPPCSRAAGSSPASTIPTCSPRPERAAAAERFKEINEAYEVVVPERPTDAERTAYETLKKAASAPADQPARV